MGKKAAAPPEPPPPFAWPARYRPVHVQYQVASPRTAKEMTAAEYEQKRRLIPWQFRPPVRHEMKFKDEVEAIRPYVVEMVRATCSLSFSRISHLASRSSRVSLARSLHPATSRSRVLSISRTLCAPR